MKLIGIDVGGTNTRVRVRSLEHDAEVTTSLKTNEWLTPNGLADTVSVRNLLRVASDAGANRHDSLAIGAHGCDSLIQIRGFTNSLRQQHDGPLKVVNDADLLAPAAGITAAIGVIAGTGSIVTGRTHDGESITAGGHGWMIGDPGSAPGITREAVLATLDQADRGAIPDQLAHRLMDYYGVSDVADLPAAFARGASIHFWAGAAPLVFETAEVGSQTALRVILAAAKKLAISVKHVFERGAEAEAVIAAGGVLVNQPSMQAALKHSLHDIDVQLPFIVLEKDPVAGAVQLARQNALFGTKH